MAHKKGFMEEHREHHPGFQNDDADFIDFGGASDDNTWIVTFTDLVSLMLTFFVMLFAMSNVKSNQWDDMTDAFSRQLNPSKQKQVAAATAEYTISTVYRRRAIDLDYLVSVLEKIIRDDDVLAQSNLVRLDDRLLIALPGDLLFQPGSAILAPEAERTLFNLGGILRNIGNAVAINGHTDPTPPHGGTYTSNWELSTARAVAVANFLRRSGYAEDITAVGFADSMFTRLPDVPDEDRKRLGRRVDIVVLETVRW